MKTNTKLKELRMFGSFFHKDILSGLLDSIKHGLPSLTVLEFGACNENKFDVELTEDIITVGKNRCYRGHGLSITVNSTKL
jgi:hypothetical protein